jgi:parallel beta-helix repeat protein
VKGMEIKKITKKMRIFLILLIIIIVNISTEKTLETNQISNRRQYQTNIIETIKSNNYNYLFVGGTGPNNYTKIQDAIDNATDFDCIFVYDENSPYREQILVNRPLTIIGENKNTTTIEGNNTANASVVTLKANSVIIKGFMIKNSNSRFNGININSRYSKISDCIIKQNSGKGIIISGSTNISIYNNIIINNNIGIYLENSFEILISRNRIENNTEDAITLKNSYKNIISDNRITIPIPEYSWRKAEGIKLGGGSNTISRNIILGERAYDIGLHSSEDYNIITDNIFINSNLIITSSRNIVKNNTINDKPIYYLTEKSNITINQAGQIILFKCNNITIEKNNLSRIINAVEIHESNNINISDNIFYKNKFGIKLILSQFINIKNNSIDSQINHGLYLSESNNNILKGNFFYNNSDAITLLNSNKNIITNNEINENIDGIYLFKSNKNNIILNHIINNNDGIYIEECSKNIITKNNLFENHLNSFFKNAINNQWKKNYWNKTSFPYLITGIYYREGGEYFGAPPPITIPLLKFDWLPAKKPYNWRE